MASLIGAITGALDGRRLRQPGVSLTWAGKDVSAELAAYVEELTYTDSLQGGEGQTDEVSIKLDNSSRRFLAAWWPTEGAILEPAITWTENGQTHRWALGAFTIDTREIRFAPAVLSVRAMSQAAGGTALHKRQSRGWESVSLGDVVRQVAGETGLTAQFEAEDVRLSRLDQRNESAHQLLTRLAKTYGAVYAVKGRTLLFSDSLAHGAEHQIDLAPTAGDVTAADFSLGAARKTKGTLEPGTGGTDAKSCGRTGYQAVEISYYDALKKESVTYTERVSGSDGGPVLRLREQARDLADARRRVRAQLGHAGGTCTLSGEAAASAPQGDATRTAGANADAGGRGNLTLVGRPIAAGDRVQILNAGKLSGPWRVARAVHTLSPSQGWTTRLELESSDFR